MTNKVPKPMAESRPADVKNSPSETDASRGGDGDLYSDRETDLQRRSRRAAANTNERRRMESINKGFDDLKVLIPLGEGEKMSKAAILQKTAQFTNMLLSENRRLRQQVNQLQTQLAAALQAQAKRTANGVVIGADTVASTPTDQLSTDQMLSLSVASSKEIGSDHHPAEFDSPNCDLHDQVVCCDEPRRDQRARLITTSSVPQPQPLEHRRQRSKTDSFGVSSKTALAVDDHLLTELLYSSRLGTGRDRPADSSVNAAAGLVGMELSPHSSHHPTTGELNLYQAQPTHLSGTSSLTGTSLAGTSSLTSPLVAACPTSISTAVAAVAAAAAVNPSAALAYSSGVAGYPTGTKQENGQPAEADSNGSMVKVTTATASPSALSCRPNLAATGTSHLSGSYQQLVELIRHGLPVESFLNATAVGAVSSEAALPALLEAALAGAGKRPETAGSSTELLHSGRPAPAGTNLLATFQLNEPTPAMPVTPTLDQSALVGAPLAGAQQQPLAHVSKLYTDDGPPSVKRFRLTEPTSTVLITGQQSLSSSSRPRGGSAPPPPPQPAALSEPTMGPDSTEPEPAGSSPSSWLPPKKRYLDELQSSRRVRTHTWCN